MFQLPDLRGQFKRQAGAPNGGSARRTDLDSLGLVPWEFRPETRSLIRLSTKMSAIPKPFSMHRGARMISRALPQIQGLGAPMLGVQTADEPDPCTAAC